MNDKDPTDAPDTTADTTGPIAVAVAPRVIDESAYDGGDDTDDDEDDVPDHLGMVVRADEGAAPQPQHHNHDRHDHHQTEPVVLEMAENPEIALDLIDADALWVVKRLRMKGFEAYLTGGCVRDLLLGRKPKDFDVATAAHPNQVRTVFRNCRLIGRRFRLAHVYFANGKVIETATFRANPIEVSNEATAELGEDAPENEAPQDYLVERDNVFGNVEQDARRRDLTINGLFYDPIAGKIIDYVDGRRDLEQQLIRTIGDPDIRFQEDPVRIMRAIKFATRLGFSIETATREAMTKHAPALLRCAPARLQEELLRLLTSGYAQGAMTLADNCGVLQAIIPELVAAMNEPMVVEPEVIEPMEPMESLEPMAAVEAVAGEGSEAAAEVAEVAAAAVEPMPVVPLVPLVQPATPEQRWLQLSSLLGALDATREREVDVSAAVVLATLVTPIARALHVAGRSFDAWYGATADQWTARWRLTRHDRERVQSILQMQPDLEPHRRRGPAAKQTVSRPWFREALLMDILQHIADNQPLDEINRWKVVAQHAGAQYQQSKAMPHGARAPRERTEFRGGRGGDRDRGGRGRGRGGGGGGERGRRRG